MPYKDPEQRKIYRAAYYAADPAGAVEKTRAWRQANRDRKNASARARYKADPDKARGYQRTFAAKHAERLRFKRVERKHGITREDYQRMLEQQGGVCAICEMPPRGVRGNTANLVVDHDHKSGEVRGLLCSVCNSSLGGFGDETKRLASAMQYLYRWKLKLVPVKKEERHVG